MMKNILSDIYQGNYTVHDHKNRKGTPFAETMDRIEKLEEEIRKALPEGSKATFDEYMRAALTFRIWPARRISLPGFNWAYG